MMRATKIHPRTPPAVRIRPPHQGGALPVLPAGSTLARLLTTPRVLRGRVWRRALAGLLMGILALLTWPGMLRPWSPHDLSQPGNPQPGLGFRRLSPPVDRMAPKA